MKKVFIYIACAIILSGCMIDPPQQIHAETKCMSLGLKPGTRDYIGCVMYYEHQNSMNIAAYQAASEERKQRIGMALQGMMNGIQQNSYNNQPQTLNVRLCRSPFDIHCM